MLEIDANSERLIALWINFFVYGIYVVLFWVCMYLYRRSHRRSDHKIALSAIVALFSLCTMKLVLDVTSVLLVCFPGTSVGTPLIQLSGYRVAFAAGHVYIITNIIADSLLIYRCYIIWDSRMSVIVAPILLLLVAAGLAFASYPVSALVAYVTLATNILVTGLSAGRIWWISRRLSNFLGPKIYSKYKTVLSILIESASLYPICLIAFSTIMMTDGPSQSIQYWATYYLVSNVVGIAPTLLLVRIGLGADVYNQSTRSALEFERTRSTAFGPQAAQNGDQLEPAATLRQVPV